MPLTAARRIYPQAGKAGRELVLVEPVPGLAWADPVLAVTSDRGRVDGLIFPIGGG